VVILELGRLHDGLGASVHGFLFVGGKKETMLKQNKFKDRKEKKVNGNLVNGSAIFDAESDITNVVTRDHHFLVEVALFGVEIGREGQNNIIYKNKQTQKETSRQKVSTTNAKGGREHIQSKIPTLLDNMRGDLSGFGLQAAIC
jgi:hypothetical protein